MSKKQELNLRDLGDAIEGVPKGLFLRSGKLSIFTKEECADLCWRYNIKSVIDLRTPIESAEFQDPLPESVEYLQIPILKDSAVGITHETGSDPMTIIEALYMDIVTDDYCRRQLDKVVATLRGNAEKGICTLFHCTAGKDRTGIVSMALLKSYGISDAEIIKDYMRTNYNALWPTIKKCVGVGLMTWNWELVKTAYVSFMARRELIETSLKYYVV